ncbi:MBL fold metallo-hydrolase [Williamsia sterculiae]|uniref:L-ascorbate metabolism protein UlaG, beta-lactamase superfamily n=1 Tax=Williamsia sterculiae TaxID=1344003 RepID=A0A1N7FVM0_9NOCA|nr:MBL fold metallo-hydrolase [Williamsia sterculiae]SIS04398.1 L-ascorbate metabolism protein UlaG, beta-lactamase superfamily [Williamsia sterculiae]
MRITHFGHSCILVEIDGSRILFDPGTLSHGFEGLTGLDAILITHQHPDHVDVERLPDLLSGNPHALLRADPQTSAQLRDDNVGGDWVAAQSGDEFAIGSVTARVGGGKHAVIHSEIPVVDNVAYMLGDAEHPSRLLHPGDNFYAPTTPVEVLALPASAPWMRLSESVDYLRAVAPTVAVPIHQAVLSGAGVGVHHARLDEMKPAGTEFRVLPDENDVELP